MVETGSLPSKAKDNIDLIKMAPEVILRRAKAAVITQFQDGGGDGGSRRGGKRRERLCPPLRWRPPWALSLAPPRGLRSASPAFFPPALSLWAVRAEELTRGEWVPGS